MRRRIFLSAGTIALLATGLTRTSLAVPTEAQAEAYGGAVDGAWTCGPRATATYGGIGGQVRVYPASAPTAKPEDPPVEDEEHAGDAERMRPDGDDDRPERKHGKEPPREPAGVSFGLAGVGEQRGYKRLRCAGEGCDETDKLPPARLLGGGRVDAGYDGRYFGFHLGALVAQRWDRNDAANPETFVLPAAEFRFARRVGWHALLGFGDYNASTLMRPGLYSGVGWQSEGGVAVEGRVALNLAFDDEVGGRLDGRVRVPLGDAWGIGIGIASQTVRSTLPEGSLFVLWTP